VVGRYEFPQLTAILSPAWAPDGKMSCSPGWVVSGYSDLYRLWLADGRLERSPPIAIKTSIPRSAPTARQSCSASDRTAFGRDGRANLFRLDLATVPSTIFTYGDWHDEQPRWSARRGGSTLFRPGQHLPDLFGRHDRHRRRRPHSLNGAFRSRVD